MRILLITEAYNSIGGISEIVDNLYARAVERGHDVRLVSRRDPFWERNGNERVGREGVVCTWIEIRRRKRFTWRHPERLLREPLAMRMSPLARLIREWSPDVVHSHVYEWDAYPTIVAACRAGGVPLVQSLYDPRARGKLGDKALRPLAYASALTAISAATRDHLARIRPELRRAKVIIGGVDLVALAAALPYAHPRPYIFCAARLLLTQKAIDHLLAAFKSVSVAHPGVDLLIAGDGPDRERIAELISELSLGERVQLLGLVERERLLSLHKGALFFAMPSRNDEGLGVVFLEAGAAGKAVIGTRCGGVPEVLINDRNGLLAEEADLNGFTAALRKLLDDAPYRDRMGEQGRVGAAQYAWPIFADRYLELYQSCLRKRAA